MNMNRENKDVHYAQIRSMDIANGEYIGCAVYFQGCPFHCYNCFNESTWDYDGGEIWTESQTNEVYSIIEQPHIRRITFLGGEPMIDRNLDLLIELTTHIKNNMNDKLIWIYSGYLFENLVGDLAQDDCSIREKKCRQILMNCDILVDGQFKDDLKDFKMKFRGSTNQRIINVKESIENQKVVLNDKLMAFRNF